MDQGSDLRGLSGRITTVAVVASAPLAAVVVGAAVALVTAGADDRTASLLVLVATASCLLVVVVGAVALYRGVARPLARLRSVLAHADPDAMPPDVLDRPDEVGALARSLAGAVARVNEQRELVEELSLRDADTGLYAVREFRQRLENEVARSRRHARTLTLLVASVEGRESLTTAEARAVAAQLEASIRPTDIAARTGLARFAAILPETAGHGAEVVAERLRTAVRELPDDLVLSVGLAAFPGDAGTADQLVIAADDATGAASLRGGDQIRHYGDL
ncbi:MAG: diguanylate cyclase [Actinobacteria bacterium]|nr:diguanylate cyclase [Actinomycetota bacterium]